MVQMKLWKSLFVAAILVAPAIATASPNKTGKPSSTAITEIVMERVGGGPQWSGNGWPQDRIILRSQTKAMPFTSNDFRNLAQWLLRSGFFSRKTGYIARPFPPDVGFLVITAAWGNQHKQVYSYNGARDAELWSTEMAIRGFAATLQLQAARSAWVKKHDKSLQGSAGG